MKKSNLLACALIIAPFTASAAPVVGDVLGTNPTDATAALAEAGCFNPQFEAENGKVEARCFDTQNKMWSIYIDPQTGVITRISDRD